MQPSVVAMATIMEEESLCCQMDKKTSNHNSRSSQSPALQVLSISRLLQQWAQASIYFLKNLKLRNIAKKLIMKQQT